MGQDVTYEVYTLFLEMPEGTKELFTGAIDSRYVQPFLLAFSEFQDFMPALRIRVKGHTLKTLVLTAEASQVTARGGSP